VGVIELMDRSVIAAEEEKSERRRITGLHSGSAERDHHTRAQRATLEESGSHTVGISTIRRANALRMTYILTAASVSKNRARPSIGAQLSLVRVGPRIANMRQLTVA
jgi:hypothetical protein